MTRFSTFVVFILLLSINLLQDVYGSAKATNGQMFYVPDNFATIQLAIENASDNDTIIVRKGVYEENIHNFGKQLFITSLFLFTADSSDIAQTIVDGQGTGPVVSIDNSTATTLMGFTVRNADTAFKNNTIFTGSGINVYKSQVALKNMIITNNFANQGGGVYSESSGINIENCYIANNKSYDRGGGIYANGSVVNILSTYILSNRSESGGGCFTSYSKVTVKNSLVAKNVSNNNGGGLCNTDNIQNTELVNVTMALNHCGGLGAAMYNTNGVTILNSLITNNIGNYGIYVTNGNATTDLFYNNVWKHEIENYHNCGTGVGDNTTENANAVPCDLYYNISRNPYYTDTTTFNLLPNSPCIDAGGSNTSGSTDILGMPRISDGNSDGVGILDIGAFEYQETQYPVIAYEKRDASDSTTNDAFIYLTVSGGTPPYQYLWHTGDTNQNLTNIGYGTYQVTATDYLNLKVTEKIQVGVYDSMKLSAVVNNESIAGYGDGYIDLTVHGGAPPYKYIWNTSDTTEDLNNLHANRYYVMVTDKTEAQLTDTFEITVIDSTQKSIQGKVLAQNPIEGAQVLAYLQVNNMYKLAQIDSTSNTGEFFLVNLQQGNYKLYAIPAQRDKSNLLPGYYAEKTNWENADEIQLEERVFDVDIKLNTVPYTGNGFGKITGYATIEDTSCITIENFKLWYQNARNTRYLPNLPILLTSENGIVKWTLTDTAGFFEFDNLEYGTYWLNVQKSGYQVTYNKTIELTEINPKKNTTVWLRCNDIILEYFDDNSPEQSPVIVYPNPFENHFYIDFRNNEVHNFTIELYNTSGLLCYKNTFIKQQDVSKFPITPGNLAKGIYFLKLNTPLANINYILLK